MLKAVADWKVERIVQTEIVSLQEEQRAIPGRMIAESASLAVQSP